DINQTNTDIPTYCIGHITNDWNVLLRILNTLHKNLALLLHSILELLTNSLSKNISLKKAADSATNSKDSINRIENNINIDKHNLEHLPKLWHIHRSNETILGTAQLDKNQRLIGF
ncbi:40104_t:CDS:2, partial [Gigaspora margarita]